MTPRRRFPRLALVLSLLLATTAWAQYEEDDRTDDHARQDRRYLQRYQEQTPPPDTDEDRARAEAEFFRFVDDLIRDRNYRAANSERYRVQTDDPRLDPESVTELLERFRDWFDAFWSPRIPPKPYEGRARIFLFYSFYKYNKLLHGDFSRSEIRPAGHYGAWFDAVTIHTDADPPGDLPDTLVHEAAHQLLDRCFDWKTGQPIWLAEGMASYFGYTFMDKQGTFEPGRVGGKQIALLRTGKVLKGEQARLRLKGFREAIKQGAGGDSIYGDLLASNDPRRFYGGNPAFNYAASWMLVHYLLHGEDGRHRDAFTRYIEAEMRGEGGPDVLYREIGMTPEALDRAVAAYAKTVKL
jgi:hypothetical protein